MNLTFTPADAELLSGFVASVLVPFAVSWLKQEDWPDWLKLVLALALSVLGGFLAKYASGELASVTSVIAAGMMIFVAAQANFATWFQGLGFEAVLAPKVITVTLEDDPSKGG